MLPDTSDIINHGQCHNGASSMSGAKGDMANLISDDEPRAVYTHCYRHALHLSVGDTMKQCKVMQSALDTVYTCNCEISIIIAGCCLQTFK